MASDEHLLAELRRPGAPMRACPLKLPSDRLEHLHRQAERRRCFPSALARVLLIKALDQLEQEVD
jgi:hypothetical protein